MLSVYAHVFPTSIFASVDRLLRNWYERYINTTPNVLISYTQKYSVFKFGASSLTQHLAGYEVQNIRAGS
jgi:hypothetical protein